MLGIDLRRNDKGACVVEISHHYGTIPREVCMVPLSLEKGDTNKVGLLVRARLF
jgi:hypothetical protein